MLLVFTLEVNFLLLVNSRCLLNHCAYWSLWLIKFSTCLILHCFSPLLSIFAQNLLLHSQLLRPQTLKGASQFWSFFEVLKMSVIVPFSPCWWILKITHFYALIPRSCYVGQGSYTSFMLHLPHCKYWVCLFKTILWGYKSFQCSSRATIQHHKSSWNLSVFILMIVLHLIKYLRKIFNIW